MKPGDGEHPPRDPRQLDGLDTYPVAQVEAFVERIDELEVRCKRLEEAGDEMADWNMTAPNLGCDPELLRKWQQAKEAKP